MNCPKCKAEIADNLKTCPECGFDIELYKEAFQEINQKKIEELNHPKNACPECGESVPDDVAACPNCGYPIKRSVNVEKTQTVSNSFNISKTSDTSTTPTTPTKKKVLIVISLLLVCVAGWYIWFSSTRCEWSGCMEHKASGSSYCTYHKNYLKSLSSYSSGSSSYSSKSRLDLQISNVSVHSNSVSTYCTGTIKNNGDSSFKFVQVKGSFKDSSGNVIETGDGYAVGSEGLSPGESTSFKIYCDHNSKVKSCSVTIYDYD